MQQYHVTGMSCAACSARVEKAVSQVPGVTSVAVSLLTNSMGVEGTASSDAIIKAVTDAGYGASVKGASAAAAGSEDTLKDTETPRLLRRLIISAVLTLVLMYFSMGHMMWGWPIPAWFNGNHAAMGLVQLLLSALIMVINQKFFISGFTSLLHRAPNMDTLVAMGSMTSFVWSVYVLFRMTAAAAAGDPALCMELMDQFYFESAAMILTLITVGKTLEAYSKGKTTDALKSLMRLTPEKAVLLRDGAEVTVPVAEVRKGDIFVVRPGESIPVDGIILEGNTAVNESALTGESIPADKTAGDTVSAATINQSGFIRCEASRVGEDTTLSQIIRMVSDAAATKAPIARIADKVSGIFVPVVISITVVTLAVWLLCGAEFSYALERAISVLVISCPCALGLATPVAIMVGNGVGARSGILFKTAVSQEETGRIQIVALDKTGTITEGFPQVTDLIPAEGISEEELLLKASALESRSEHPLAKAILTCSCSRQNTDGTAASCAAGPGVSDFQSLPGNGLKGILNGKELVGGSLKFMETLTVLSGSIREKADQFSSEGKTPLFFAEDGHLLGMIAVADVIRKDSPQAVHELQHMGIRVVMLTGDNERTARAIGAQAGVDEVIAGVLPDQKEKVIRLLKKQGKTAMVGDGINDAPALTRADIGIAIGAGTDVAIDAADVVLMKSRLSDVPAAIRLSRRTLTNIHENLFWAFFYNIIGIPLAAGCYIALFGWELNPMFGAAAMSLSSFCVVSNALRLNLFRIHSAKSDRPLRKAVKALDMSEIEAALLPSALPTVTFRIEGMMCPHCEARVKKALEVLPFIETAVTSFQKGTAVCTLSAEPDETAVKDTVEDAGYTYQAMER